MTASKATTLALDIRLTKKMASFTSKIHITYTLIIISWLIVVNVRLRTLRLMLRLGGG